MSVQMTQRLEIRKIDELIPYANNARVHSPAQIEQLRRSLREFGFVSPVLIDSAGNVIAGHGRIQAAKLEGIQEAPCALVEHLSDAQRRAYILADNRLAEAASWDEPRVSAELLRLRGEGMDLTLTGFSPADIVLTATDDVHEDDCDLSLPDEATVEPGQLWQLGRHRLMCGDATSPPPCAPVHGRRTACGPPANGSAVWRGLFVRRRQYSERRKKRRSAFQLFASGAHCCS